MDRRSVSLVNPSGPTYDPWQSLFRQEILHTPQPLALFEGRVLGNCFFPSNDRSSAVPRREFATAFLVP